MAQDRKRIGNKHKIERKNRELKKSIVIKEEPERRMLEKAKVLDYVTLHGLSTQIGCDLSILDVVIMKELVDNALDACKEANPIVEVTFNTEHQFMTLSVRDNGKGLTETDVIRFTDFEKSYSTKCYYKCPSRGALGNAVKCMLGTPYALASECNAKYTTPPIQIRSKNMEYTIQLLVQELIEEVKAKCSSKKIDFVEGTEFSLQLPVYKEYWGLRGGYRHLLDGYALFNPGVTFKITMQHPKIDSPYIFEYPSMGARSKEFTQFVGAYIRDVQSSGENETLRQFISRFRGLSSYNKVNEVLEEIQKGENEFQHVSDLAGNDETIGQLYRTMKNHSRDPNPDVLGEIGKEQIQDRIRRIFGDLKKFKYQKASEVYNKGLVSIPFVIETAVAVLPEDSNTNRRIFIGINNSPCLLAADKIHWHPQTRTN